MTADAAHRDAARLRLEANVVVEAGAGTGKTTLLTDRLLFLLLGRGVPATGLVALTFTEKAAGEIKVRLSERLLAVLAALGGAKVEPRTAAVVEELRRVFKQSDETVAARARKALEELDKASIGTIHSFCAQVLRLYPVQAGVDPGFRVDEGPFFDELFAAEWAKWLDRELGEEAPRAAAWLEVLRLCGLEDLSELARALAEESLELSELGGADPDAAAWLRARSAELRAAAEGQPKPRSNSRIFDSLESIRARLEEAAGAAGSEDPELPAAAPAAVVSSSWPSGWAPEGKPLYEECLELAQSCSGASEALVRRAAALLLPFARAFRASYARLGLVSFDGLLRRARDLVRDHPPVREELKARFATLLIDEFQDTDPLQGELLLYLCEEPGRAAAEWRQIKPGAGRIFVVGDPKQSIYRFRGADIAAYEGFTRHILRGGRAAAACDLTANFRSHEGIVGPVNAVFARAMEYAEGSQPAYKAIEAQAPAEASGVELVCVRPPQGAKAEAAVVQRTEAGWAAAWVSENCGEGKPWRHKDVAVLLRTSSALAPLLEAFKARGVPYAVEMERFFYGAPEVQDLLNLLRALDDPADRLALAGLLRSPLVVLDDAELLELSEKSGLSYRREPPASLRDRVGPLYACLRALRERVGREPLGDLVAAALSETALVEAAARAYHGQQTVANLLKFARLAAEASDGRGLTLKEFIGEVASAMRDSRPEGENPLADEHLDAVRVLSIHKSKGLEFPVVFVMNLAGRSGAPGRGPAALADWTSGRAGLRVGPWSSAGRARLEAREAARQRDETLRLLYVALTRPRRRLFLLGGAKGDRSALCSRLAEAGAWPLEDEAELRLPGVPVPLPVRWVRMGECIVEAGGAGQRLVGRLPLPPAAELARLWRARVARRDAALSSSWTTSPTAYLREAKPERELEESRLAPSATGALVGQLCHKVLEAWDFGAADELAPALAAAARALAASNPLADWEAALSEAEKVLESFLGSKTARELGSVEILGREVPFCYAEGGTVMRGSIDLLYRKDGRTVVVDYKTDKVSKKDLAARQEKYERQGAAYRAAVTKALGVDCDFRLVFLRE